MDPMATAFPHFCAQNLRVIDADIAHIRSAIGREFSSPYSQPVLRPFYWRERLLALVSAFDLLLFFRNSAARSRSYCADSIVSNIRSGNGQVRKLRPAVTACEILATRSL